MSIYDDFVYGVEEGKPFTVCIEKSTLVLNGKAIVKDGVYEGELHSTLPEMTEDEVLTEIERLYARYKYSLPSKRSKDYYFYALPYEELSDKDMVLGELREFARAKLEAFVLCAKLLDKIHIRGWFWKSRADPDLIILRDWIDN